MNFSALMQTLPVTVSGMGGIFIVIGIIYLSIMLLNYLGSDSNEG